MLRLRALLLSLLAVLALMSPSFAVGLGIAADGCGPYASSSPAGEPVNLPSPCELMGGKRVMPAAPDLQARRAVEVPKATEAQWQFGLVSDPIREGRAPMTELEPPRAA
jgi:hypothetical protein